MSFGVSRVTSGFPAHRCRDEWGLMSGGGGTLRVPLHFLHRYWGLCGVGTVESGLILCWGMELHLPLEFFMGCQATCQVVLGTCGFFQRMKLGCQCPFVLWFHTRGYIWRGPWASGLTLRAWGNRCLLECGTTHEDSPQVSKWDQPPPEVRWEWASPLSASPASVFDLLSHPSLLTTLGEWGRFVFLGDICFKSYWNTQFLSCVILFHSPDLYSL